MSTTTTTWRAPEWHMHRPAKEAEAIAQGNARQVSLRARLRAHYWLNEVRPLTPDDVELHCRRMARISAADLPTQADRDDLLTPDFGFLADGDSWVVPDLLEAWSAATEKRRKAQEYGRQGGKKAASSRARLAAGSDAADGRQVPAPLHPSEEAPATASAEEQS